MTRAATLTLLLAATGARLAAQGDSLPAQSGIYNRPFLAAVGRTALGGYVEGNTNYFRADGITEGLSMELRRFNVFVFSPIGARIRFIAELEFEHGTEEINLETALLDFEVNPSFVLRAGILLPPLGAFNMNHDSPRWDVVDRPLVSTEIIPATLSEVGFGVHGRLFPRGAGLTYDVYLTNGLNDGVLLNEFGRTRLASGKGGSLFAEDNNGSPNLAARVALQRGGLGEIGLSYYGGPYNTYRADGLDIDERRDVRVAAIDLAADVGPVALRGEWARAWIDIPAGLREVLGERQWGFHLDGAVTLWRPRIRGLAAAALAGIVRIEHVDYNHGRFASTGDPIGDEVTALVTGIAFRPVPGTVIKANYRYEWIHDLQGNAAARRAGVQVGVASYF